MAKASKVAKKQREVLRQVVSKLNHRLDRLEKAWVAKFNESFDKINIDKEEAETSDTEKESINPFEDTEA